MAAHPLRPVPLHRHDSRLDDSRAWPATLARYGLLRTAEGASPLVHSGNALFTLLGFLGLYLLLGLLFLFLLGETIRHGPVPVGPQMSEQPIDKGVNAQ